MLMKKSVNGVHHLLSFWPRLVRSGVRPSEATPNVA
jgi:hypothetical protein